VGQKNPFDIVNMDNNSPLLTHSLANDVDNSPLENHALKKKNQNTGGND